MRLTDKIPAWIKFPMSAAVYGVALYLLYQTSSASYDMRVVMVDPPDCVGGPGRWPRGQALATTQKIAACLKERDGLLRYLMMRPLHQLIEALPNHPAEYVGVWNGVQPRCSYRHVLKADGSYISSPGSAGCSISQATYRGHWGVVDGQMIWMNDGRAWPPDINAMDVVNKDLILLTEADGTRTKFSRATDVTDTEKVLLGLPARPALDATMPVAKGTQAGPADPLFQWPSERVEAAKPKLERESFLRTTLSKPSDWDAQLPPAPLAEVKALIRAHGCTKGEFALYSRPESPVRALVGSGCEGRDGDDFSQYPLVLIVREDAVKRIDLAPHAFMYSSTLDAFTDLNGDGRIEIWLSGYVCECDGEPEEGQEAEPCDCHDAVVVDDIAAPPGRPAEPSAPTSTPAANPEPSDGAQPAAISPAPSAPA